MSMIVLRPWEKRVSGNAIAAKISIQDGKVEYQLEKRDTPKSYVGWYGIYDNELFGVYLDVTSNGANILIGEKFLQVEKIVSVEWASLIRYRRLSITTSTESIDFFYQKLWWNLFRRPLQGVFGVLLADDWWGVTCDLPGWFAVNWKSSELEKLINPQETG